MDYCTLIDKRIEAVLSTIAHPNLKEALHYALFSGGKRLRPKMVLSITGEVGLDVAIALEFIHTYSLVHDDLPSMDDDDFRRGKPTLHKAFNESTAILIGDLLLTLAFQLLSESKLSPELIVKTIQIVTNHIGGNGLIEGQFLDLEAKRSSLEWQEYQYIALRKTGDLFTTALVCGAHIKNLNEVEIAIYAQIGQTYGLLYQIKDDVEDKNSPFSPEILLKCAKLLTDHAEHLLSRLSAPNSFLSSLFTTAVTEISDQTLSAVSHMSKNA